MMRIKLFMSLVLTIVLLIGCSTSNNLSTEGDTGKSDEEVTTISYLAHSSWEGPIKKVIEAFEEEYPDIKIDLQLNPYEKLTETIEIKMSSKDTDLDIISVDAPLTPSYSVKGYLEPLDSLLGETAKQTFLESSIEAGTYDGQLMAAPMNTSSVVLFYNKDILQDKGVSFPSEDVEERLTWEELVEMAKQLSGDNVYGFTFDQVGRAYQLLALGESKGAQVISDNGIQSEGYTNSKEMVEAYQFYYDLFNTWNVSPKISREEAPDYFISGNVAMYLGTTQNAPKIEQSGMNFGVAPHPYFENGEVATPTGSWHMGISKFSGKKEEAAKFVEFLTVGNGAKIWFEENGALPANKDLLNEIETDEKYDEFPNSIIRLAAYEANETAVNRPKTPGYLEWETNVNKAFEDIKNGTDPQMALDMAVQIIDRQLEKYSSIVE